MPSTGAPGNITYPDDTYPVAPLENLFLIQATSVNVALAAIYAQGWARGTSAQYSVTNPAALDAITTGVVGDIAHMSAPGTGVFFIDWMAYTGSGGGLDWQPIGDIQATSKANMDAFIAVISPLADLSFRIGAKWIDTATRREYVFTSNSGSYGMALVADKQVDTTNSIEGLVIQHGRARMAANGATTITKAITFPNAFITMPSVLVTYIGRVTVGGGAYNEAGLNTTPVDTNPMALGPSTTGFTLAALNAGGFTLGPDYYFAWEAIGRGI